MNKILFVLLFSFMSFNCYSIPSDQIVMKQTLHYITIIHFTNAITGQSQGYVIKQNHLTSTHYQIYDEDDQFLGSAEDSNLSKQASKANMKLYGSEGEEIGTIQGESLMAYPTKFTIKSDVFNGSVN